MLQSYTRPFNFLYAAIFNVLGFPVTSVPMGLGKKDGMPAGIQVNNIELRQRHVHRCLLSTQVVASPMNDRLTISVARNLERAFGGWEPPFNTRNLVRHYKE